MPAGSVPDGVQRILLALHTRQGSRSLNRLTPPDAATNPRASAVSVNTTSPNTFVAGILTA